MPRGCGIEQRCATGRRHPEQLVDTVFAQSLQDVIGNGESHASLRDHAMDFQLIGIAGLTIGAWSG
jgi:hypothetical protein